MKEKAGDCECPIKGCAEVIPVYKYEGSGDPKKRRFAGRLYGVCPVHGRVENQEFMLCNAKLRSPNDQQSDASDASNSNASSPVKPPVATRPLPQPKSQPITKQPSTKGNWWDNWGTIIK